MGIGDQLLGTGFAKGAAVRGKRIAFGDRRRIIWDQNSEQIFRGNPNIARPGTEFSGNIEWVEFFRGNRQYNRLDREQGRWLWQYSFKAISGEIFFDKSEIERGSLAGKGFIYVEPNVPWHKSVAVNKDWGLERYQAVVDRLLKDGHDVVQSKYGRNRLQRVRMINTVTFRDALAVMSRARAALVPEGGLHHGAAALDIPAVVIFGGFIPPAVVGYDGHINLTGEAEACGSLNRCQHCRDALNRISVEEAYEAIKSLL